MEYYEYIHKMLSTNKLHRKAIETVVDNICIHPSRHRVLMNLARQGTIRSQKEIAESLGISPAAATGSLSGLEKDGLISRSAGADGRFNEITITERGRELVDLTKEHFFEVDKETFRGLSQEELDVFLHCLNVMEDNLIRITTREDKNEKMV